MAKKKEEAKEEAENKEAEEALEPSMSSDKCISCNMSIINDVGAVKFPCPKCGKYTIIRCSKCRKIVAKYKCPLCGFEGPN